MQDKPYGITLFWRKWIGRCCIIFNLFLLLLSVLKYLKNHNIGNNHHRNVDTLDSGLWPSVFNLATKAVITTNATCGERGRQEYCRMSDNGKSRCSVCENFGSDPGKKHSINFALDGTNKWWQSPPLYYGQQYEFVTIVIDLKQVRVIVLKYKNILFFSHYTDQLIF